MQLLTTLLCMTAWMLLTMGLVHMESKLTHEFSSGHRGHIDDGICLGHMGCFH